MNEFLLGLDLLGVAAARYASAHINDARRNSCWRKVRNAKTRAANASKNQKDPGQRRYFRLSKKGKDEAKEHKSSRQIGHEHAVCESCIRLGVIKSLTSDTRSSSSYHRAGRCTGVVRDGEEYADDTEDPRRVTFGFHFSFFPFYLWFLSSTEVQR